MRKLAPRIAVQHPDLSHLPWYLAIVLISCVSWLFCTVLRVLR
jgi:hypothetical protein